MKSYDTPAPTSGSVLRDAPGLEFPDWSGILPHRSRMTFEAVVRWNDEMLGLFPRREKSPKLEAERRYHAEFVL
jgi:predicted hotdog family 3-hydroxylacyl-ACP dehydratase